MSVSVDLRGAVLSWLTGTGDVYTTLNAEIAAQAASGYGLPVGVAALAADAVFESRAIRSRGPRFQNPRPLTVEVVFVSQSGKTVGIGWEEVDLVFDLTVCLTLKEAGPGGEQMDAVHILARAIRTRYRGLSALSALTAAYPVGNLATCVRSDASMQATDSDPDSATFTRAVVRVTFTFVQPMTANT